MAIKDILVHLSGGQRAEKVIQPAITLAERHDARLIGLFAGVPFEIPAYVAAQLPMEAVEAHQEHVRESAKKAGEAFEAACKSSGVRAELRESDWRENVEDVISTHARYADVVMIMQPDEEADGSRARTVTDHIVMRAGAPVIMVPQMIALKGMGTKVMVAWDGGSQAARAVRDAMPFLEAADDVQIICVDPEPGPRGLGDLPGADLARYLATHGVKATADHLKSGDIDAGSMLLNQAADLGVDLVVAGAYGHSRLSELVLGGVTDTLIEHMAVPVLFSR